ncbi:nitrophenyl compound nitroreductase subunit ArsF family protein [Bacteroidota bacterium]
MKYLFLFIIIAILYGCNDSLNSTDNALGNEDQSSLKPLVKDAPGENDKAEVFYFHGTRRCQTCKKVGQISKSFIIENYHDHFESGLIRFIEIDFDQPGNEELVEKFEVSRSGLWIRTVFEQKEYVLNLTEISFFYADSKPDTIRTILKSNISKIL